MGFKLPDEWIEKQQRIHEMKYIDYNGNQIHVSELEDRSVTPEMKMEMRMNSYAQDDLPPKLTNATLIETAKHYISNCSTPRFPCITYDEALIHKILPEMIKRLEELDQNIEILKKVKLNKLAMDLEHALIISQTVDPNIIAYDFLKTLKDMNR